MHHTLKKNQLHVAVDLLILTIRDGQLCVLLSQRTEEPWKGCWALPGKLMGLEESAEACAESLLEEMLPVSGAYMEQLYTFSSVERDQRGRVISIAYLVIVPWPTLQPALEMPRVTLACFGMDAIAGQQLAFDHAQMIRTALLRLRGKIGYTEVSFQFLSQPEAFTLGQLQTVFEAVLGEKLDTSNFRRSILSRYETTGRIAQTESAVRQGRGRPAALYRYQPEDP
ncbi:MAG: NUDIX hydrolase [bacterium]|nr:NUDIX hydrolase [bacterium]